MFNHLHKKEKTKYLSVIGAWALAFGCSVGWGSMVMPGTTFLPMAGPLGSVLGLLIGAGFMMIIAVSYSRMMQRYPDSGGAYSYAKNVLGGDHGFLCAWMLLLTYIAIIWANTAALSMIARYLFGDILCFGFSYQVAGYTVYFGEILASVVLLVLTCLICSFSYHLAKWVQIIGAMLLFACICVCFVAVVIHNGGFKNLQPLFREGGNPAVQILGIVVLAPWAFIGFESISHSAGEFRFSVKKSLPIFIGALITGVLSYMMLTVCASMACPDGFSGWSDYIASLTSCDGIEGLPTFFNARAAMGETGIIVLGVAALCGIVTGLVGHMIALSRLTVSLSKDGLLPKKIAAENKRGVPWIAVCLITLISCVIPFFGKTAIGWIVDVTTIGAIIVYGYTSICLLVDGYHERRKSSVVFSIIGMVFSLFIILYYLFSGMNSNNLLSTESYLILVIWSILGIVVFRLLITRDKSKRFGKSFIVWIVLFVLILLVSIVWIDRTTKDEAVNVANDIVVSHNEHAKKAGLDVDSEEVTAANQMISQRIDDFGNSFIKSVLILGGFLLFSFAVIFSIFAVIKQREREIEAKQLLAEESNRAKSRFLSNMSHDIRTPLNAVTGYTSLALQEKDMSYNVRDYLEKIDNSGKYLLALINDILDMSRIESGKVVLSDEPADLFDLLEQAAAIFTNQMKQKHLDFKLDYSGVKNRYVICDKNRLDRVLLNLISNAYKFTPEGGKIAVVMRQTETKSDYASYELSVADTGIGMSPEFLEHIFEAFEREQNETVSKLQGTGLGMSIAQSFIEMMGGTISVQSEKNKGTVFTICLSFAIASAWDVVSSGTHIYEEKPDNTGKRLLIAEDNPINYEIADEILRRAGFEVEIAENGKLAVEMLVNAEPGYYSAVMMDVMMPVMNGYEATKEIRSLGDERSEIPVIAMSANTFEEDKKAASDAGMSDFVAKPYDADQLIKTISKYV